MSISGKVELALIPAFGLGFWLMARGLPHEIPAGELLLGASAMLLLQSLIRDLCLLARQKRTSQRTPRRALRCICVESTVGVTGVIAGVVLLGAKIDQLIVINSWVLSVLVMAQMGAGFLIKDYVLEWNPWKLYRDKDHLNIVFTWKK